MLWHGRGWLRKSKNYDEIAHLEWVFGRKSGHFKIGAWWRTGDSDRDMTLILCLPWMVSLYLTICNAFKYRTDKKETQTGFAIHDNTVWVHLLSYVMESNRSDPWYRKTYSWDFPWSLRHFKTEILTHERLEYAEAVWIEGRKTDFFKNYDAKKSIALSVSKDYQFHYTLKNGKGQDSIATVFVERREWRARWWPVIHYRKVSTSIDIHFSEEVGEGTGSWKGGVVGTGCEMKPGESPEQTLRRFEREHKFSR